MAPDMRRRNLVVNGRTVITRFASPPHVSLPSLTRTLSQRTQPQSSFGISEFCSFPTSSVSHSHLHHLFYKYPPHPFIPQLFSRVSPLLPSHLSPFQPIFSLSTVNLYFFFFCVITIPIIRGANTQIVAKHRIRHSGTLEDSQFLPLGSPRTPHFLGNSQSCYYSTHQQLPLLPQFTTSKATFFSRLLHLIFHSSLPPSPPLASPLLSPPLTISPPSTSPHTAIKKMLAVVPHILTTTRLDGPAPHPAIPITPVTAAAPQTTNAAIAADPSTNTATSPSTSAAPSPSKNNPNSKSGATAGAGTASTAPPLTAVGSQDSMAGSWSTLSIPKSAGTATGTAGKTSRKSTKAKSASSPQPSNRDHGPSTVVPPMTATTTGSFLAPKSRSKSRRAQRLHSNSTPTAKRTLVPEPAPPPPSALNNKPLKPPQRLSSSSKDRRPTRKHTSAERRQPTPYPLSAVTRRNRLSSGPITGVFLSEAGGSEGVRPSGLVRRPSPVPPSSSHSDSSRSSDSYVSLKDGGSALSEFILHHRGI